MGKRSRGIEQGKYALIGGKPNQGETNEDVVEREVKEETDLDFKHPRLFIEEINDQTILGQFWHTLYFIGEVFGTLNLKKDKIEEATYIDKDGLSRTEIAFGHKEIIKKYFDSLTDKIPS